MAIALSGLLVTSHFSLLTSHLLLITYYSTAIGTYFLVNPPSKS